MTALPPTSDEPKKTGRRILMQLLAGVLVFVSLGFVAAQIASGWPELRATGIDLSVPMLLLSFALLLVNFVMVAWAWVVVFGDLGQPIGLVRAFGILLSGQLGRYIPGKVWIFLGQAYAAQRMGYRKATALTAGIVQNLCGLVSSFVVIAVFAFFAQISPWVIGASAAVALAGIVVLLIAPAAVENGVNRIREKRGTEPVRLAVGRGATAKVLVILTIAWLEHCLAFVVLARSVAPVDAPTAFQLAFAYCVAYNFAYLMLIVPGGLGVREGTLTALAGPVIGSGLAGVIALLQRLWFLAGEVLGFALAVWILCRSAPLPPSDDSTNTPANHPGDVRRP